MVEKSGLVFSGQYAGWKIQVVSDRAGATGGYYLLLNSEH